MIDGADVLPESLSKRHDKAKRKVRNNKTLITLLPVIITGATFLLSFSAQLYQQRVRTQEARDAEWRSALKQVSTKQSETAVQGAYEMVSFLDDAKYGAQAAAIAAALLPSIRDHIAFDLVFFNLIERENRGNQNEFIAIDSSLTQQLLDAYGQAKENLGDLKTPPTGGDSFSNFLLHPEQFFREDTDSDKLAFVLDKAWELDSVSDGLSQLWSGQLKGKRPTLDHQGLNDLVFLNNDFSSVDFRGAGRMNNVQFLGDCKVNRAMLPPAGTTVNCSPPNPPL
jgi:hypothetical protein